MKLIQLILLVSIIIINCSDDNGKKIISSENPKEIAKLTLDIANLGKERDRFTALFEKYGYNLSIGSNMYNKVFDEINSDPEKYKIFQDELSILLKKQTNIYTKNDYKIITP